MLWRPFDRYLRSKADDTAGGGGAAAGGSGPDGREQGAQGNPTPSEGQGAGGAGQGEESASDAGEIEISDHLSSRLNPKQAEALKEAKRAKAARAAKAAGKDDAAEKAEAQKAADAKKAEAEKAAKAAKGGAQGTGHRAQGAESGAGAADGETEIDFAPAEASAAGGGEGDDVPPAEPDVNGLDETRKKQFLDLHKDNAKIRKRAQDAEKERDEIKSKFEETQRRLEEVESSPGGGAASSASGNLFAGFRDAGDVQRWAEDAQARINLILDDSKESKIHKLPDGGELDLGEDSVNSLLQAQRIIAHAGKWSETRQSHGQSFEKAKPIVKAFEKVPEFAKHHAVIAKQDPQAHWPRIVATSAIGELVASGEWKLVKKAQSGTISGKAAAASSAASTVSGAQADTANKKPDANAAPAEVKGAVPPASRTDGQGGGSVEIPSALKERAKKGDQDALEEIIRLKTRRGQQRQQAA